MSLFTLATIASASLSLKKNSPSCRGCDSSSSWIPRQYFCSDWRAVQANERSLRTFERGVDAWQPFLVQEFLLLTKSSSNKNR